MVSSVLNATEVSALTFSSLVQNISIHYPELNALERLWATYYTYMGNDIFATGLLFFLYHEFMYFGRSLPWMIIDQIPYFRQWKLQPDKVPSAKEQFECFKSVMTQHLFIEAIPIWTFHPICSLLDISISVPFPAWSTILYQIAIFFVLEDTWHYVFHRIFHIGPFYKYIHKQHHRYAAPFGLTAEYAHPVEVACLGFGTVGFPIIYAALTRKLHLFTVMLWVALRLFQAVDSHSGYDFPWSLNKFLPFWAGAEHHDLHHKYFIGNYASSFRWWDYSLDTEAGPIAKHEREARQKKAMARANARKERLASKSAKTGLKSNTI